MVWQSSRSGTRFLRETRDHVRRPMSARTPLFAQPGSFWVGAYMVAEGPFLLAASFMEPAARDQMVDVMLGSPLALLAVAIAVAVAGLFVGWLAHRMGLGQ